MVLMRSSQALFGTKVALLMLSALAACSTPVSVPSPDAETVPVEHADAATVLRAFRDASNSHDVEAVEALLADEVVWHRGAASRLSGRDAVMVPITFDAATHATFTIGELTFDGDSVACVLTESNDFYRALGLPSVDQRAQFEIRDGRIVSITSLPSPEPTEQELTVGRFLTWFTREYPSDADLVLGGGGPRAVDAALMVERANEWAQTR